MRKILLIMLFILSCAKAPIVSNMSAPPDPVMLPVKVRAGAIAGTDLTNVIENHQRLWKHIHKLKALGFKKH